jgi:hypothetical protein
MFRENHGDMLPLIKRPAKIAAAPLKAVVCPTSVNVENKRRHQCSLITIRNRQIAIVMRSVFVGVK